MHAIVYHMMCIASEINNNAHSLRTCWCPRCLARGLCHMNTTCLPVKSTRQHVRSTHPVRQPLERRHRSPCTLQHDPRVVGLCRAWRAAACRHDGPQSRGQQQAHCRDIMAYKRHPPRRRHTGQRRRRLTLARWTSVHLLRVWCVLSFKRKNGKKGKKASRNSQN